MKTSKPARGHPWTKKQGGDATFEFLAGRLGRAHWPLSSLTKDLQSVCATSLGRLISSSSSLGSFSICQSALSMSSLSIFPIEILENITGDVITSEQMRLWQCGDRNLNIKLKNGVLKRTSLCWSSSSWMPWPRPFFTIHSHLEDVEWRCILGESICPTLELNLLPKSLRRLCLDCNDVFILLRKQNVNMNELFPLLLTLRMKGNHLSETNLKQLPSNLVELSVTSSESGITSSSLFRDLPRNITTLELLFSINDLEEHENDLPSNLISLKLEHLYASFNWFSKLPQVLKQLSIYPGFYPPIWTTLPQLETLALFRRFQLSPSSLSEFPQSLKSLEASFMSPLNDHHISLLPKNLTRLRMLSLSEFTHSGLQQLPVSITELGASVFATHPDVLSFYPPKSVLMWVFSEGGHQLNAHPLPAQVQEMRLPYINDDICAMLPPQLRRLFVEDGFITAKGAAKFPKSLVTLLINFSVFDNNETMSHLAFIPKIEFFVQRESALSHPNRSLRGIVDFEGKNHNLENLVITKRGLKDPRSPFFADLFLSLPAFVKLKTLEMNYFRKISATCFGSIPATITHLSISLADCPTATELPSLPKGLKVLILRIEFGSPNKCDWNDEIFAALPRNLREFIIKGERTSFPNLTDGMHAFLPPNLMVLKLADDIDDEIKYSTCASWASRKMMHPPFVSPLNRLHGP